MHKLQLLSGCTCTAASCLGAFRGSLRVPFSGLHLDCITSVPALQDSAAAMQLHISCKLASECEPVAL